MKKLSLVLNLVLLAAVIVIYVLHFTGGKKSSGSNDIEGIEPRDVTSSGIVYVNIDSVIINFEMFTDKREVLAAKQKDSENELNTKGQAYEKGVLDYQNKVQKGLVTRQTAGEMEQALMQQQQALVDLRDQLSYALSEEEQVMNRQVIEYITTFLESVKGEYNYQFILGKSFGGQILYGDEALDITDNVIAGINKKYREEKAAAAK